MICLSGAKEESMTILKEQQQQFAQQQQQKQKQPARSAGVRNLNQKAAVIRSLAIFDRASAGRQLVANLVRK